jgi:hypothetical protein
MQIWRTQTNSVVQVCERRWVSVFNSIKMCLYNLCYILCIIVWDKKQSGPKTRLPLKPELSATATNYVLKLYLKRSPTSIDLFTLFPLPSWKEIGTLNQSRIGLSFQWSRLFWTFTRISHKFLSLEAQLQPSFDAKA